MDRRSSTNGTSDWDALDSAERAAQKARQGVRYAALEGLTVMDPATMQEHTGRRRDDRRGHVPRQHRHEGLSQEPRRRPTRPLPAAGSTPAISASCTLTATSSSRTAPRTSSSRAARTFPRSRSRTRSTSTPPWPLAAWSRGPTRNGARRRSPIVELKPGTTATRKPRSSTHCRTLLARFKCPKAVVFAEIPKTSTGKIQKFRLRELAKEM